MIDLIKIILVSILMVFAYLLLDDASAQFADSELPQFGSDGTVYFPTDYGMMIDRPGKSDVYIYKRDYGYDVYEGRDSDDFPDQIYDLNNSADQIDQWWLE